MMLDIDYQVVPATRSYLVFIFEDLAKIATVLPFQEHFPFVCWIKIDQLRSTTHTVIQTTQLAAEKWN